MAITLDASAHANIQATSPLTLPITIGTLTNGLLVIAFSCQNGTDLMSGGTITYNGSATGITLAKAQGASPWVKIYTLVAPTSGTHNIVLTPTANAFIMCIAASFDGAHQTTPTNNTAGSNNAFGTSPYSTSITIGSGNLGLDYFCHLDASGAATPGAGQTAVATEESDTIYRGNVSTKPGSASAMSWTFGVSNINVVHAAVELVAASGGGGGGSTVPKKDTYRRRQIA